MNTSDISSILSLQSYAYKKDINSLTELAKNTINDIDSDEISHLNSVEAALAFVMNPNKYTAVLIGLLTRQFDNFTLNKDYSVSNSNSKFQHSEIYKLIFPNQYDSIFEIEIKSIFNKYAKKLALPLQKHIQENVLQNQEDQMKLKNIEQIPYIESPNIYDIFQTSESTELENDELTIQKIIMNDLLTKHTLYNKRIENGLNELCTGIDKNDYQFLMASVKKEGRALEKLKEKVKFDYKNKQPFDSIKDLSRCSQVFKNSKSLLSFLDQFSQNINESKCFKLLELKNMFNENQIDKTKEKEKQGQKDVKIILGYKVNSNMTLNVEVQLILEDIIKSKKILHKFQDISRINYSSKRSIWYRQLAETVINRMNAGVEQKWAEGEYFYNIFERAKMISPQVNKKIKEPDAKLTKQIELDGNICKVYKNNGFHYSTTFIKENDLRINQIMANSDNFEDSVLHASNSKVDGLKQTTQLGEYKDIYNKMGMKLKISKLFIGIVKNINGDITVSKFIDGQAQGCGINYKYDKSSKQFIANCLSNQMIWNEDKKIFEYYKLSSVWDYSYKGKQILKQDLDKQDHDYIPSYDIRLQFSKYSKKKGFGKSLRNLASGQGCKNN